MPWFYAHDGQETGPVADADFERLASEGVIQPATLVWREGMANWQPYATLAPAGAAPPPPGQLLCHECRQLVPAEDTMQIGGAIICADCKPRHVQKLREGVTIAPEPVAGAPRYAGFWIRAVAVFIDGLISFIVSTAIGLATGATLRQALGFDDAPWGTRDSVMLAAGIVLDTIYEVVLLAKFGGTLGKLACGLRVIRVDGGRLSYTHALGRVFAQWLSTIPCGLGFVMAAFDGEKRTLHDRICGTRVIWKQ